MRIAAYEEYKTLRHEMHESSSISSREIGETIYGIREKVNQVEIWIRDQLRDHRHTLQGSMDMRHKITDEKIDKLNDRIRQLEIDHAAYTAAVHTQKT